MQVKNVVLFGHRELYEHAKVEKKLSVILRHLALTNPYVEIYMGRNGEFDTFVASIIKQFKKVSGFENIGMTLVLPYEHKDIEYYAQYYDSVFIPESLHGIHPKRAITERNKWMVNKCDLLICYVKHGYGGAHTALKYAKNEGKKIINLADDEK